MPKTKKQELFFTLMMCGIIAFGMASYNVIRHAGLSEYPSAIIFAFLPAFVLAFALEFLLVGKIAHGLAKKTATDKTSPIKFGLLITAYTILFMLPIMSLYGLIAGGGVPEGVNPIIAYISTFLMNLIFLIPLNLIIAQPVSRFALNKAVSLRQKA